MSTTSYYSPPLGYLNVQNTWTALQTFNAGIQLGGQLTVGTDNAFDLGTATNRFRSVFASTQYRIYAARADASPTASLESAALKFGAGGGSALNVNFARNANVARAGGDAIMLQSLVTNNSAELDIVPNGGATVSDFIIYGNSGFNNYAALRIIAQGSNPHIINSIVGGTGTLQPLVIQMNSTEVFRITTTPILVSSVQVQIGGAVGGATANQFWTASQGAASTQMFIGNASINVTSDMRLKRDITPTAINALEILNKLPVVDFWWNDPSDAAPNNRNARGKWTGILAQDMVDIVPTAINAPDRRCNTCRSGQKCSLHPNPWFVEPIPLVMLTVKAMQELASRVSKLERRGLS